MCRRTLVYDLLNSSGGDLGIESVYAPVSVCETGNLTSSEIKMLFEIDYTSGLISLQARSIVCLVPAYSYLPKKRHSRARWTHGCFGGVEKYLSLMIGFSIEYRARLDCSWQARSLTSSFRHPVAVDYSIDTEVIRGNAG